MDLSEKERAVLGDRINAYGSGNGVLAGLTHEESGFYLHYRRRSKVGYYPEPKDRDRFVALHHKHERALAR
jgi:hypothetical protein